MRFLVPLVAAVMLVAGCGTDEPDRVSASSDASELLRTTFANLSQLESATVDLKVSGKDGSASLQGPFVREDVKRLPKFSFTATFTEGARNESAGATWTGERGYAVIDGATYEVPGILARQLGAGYEQAAPLLNLDVSKWVRDARNEGIADVAGVETVKVTGSADGPQVVADVERLSALVNTLKLPGLGGASLPSQLTPQDRLEAADAIKDATVTVYTGATDQQLRRLVVNAQIDGEPVVVDLTLTKVGEDQDIAEPKDAKPFSALMEKFRASGGDELRIK